MEAIIFIGIQATGKSTFYKENFFDTHLRISLDLLNTRNKEMALMEYALHFQQRVVIDNTNPTQADRKRYIGPFKARNYKIIGYYFQSKLSEAKERNVQRSGKKVVPDKGIVATQRKLELPTFEEGFDELFYVSIQDQAFKITAWE